MAARAALVACVFVPVAVHVIAVRAFDYNPDLALSVLVIQQKTIGVYVHSTAKQGSKYRPHGRLFPLPLQTTTQGSDLLLLACQPLT
jgi:hypothetical protein